MSFVSLDYLVFLALATAILNICSRFDSRNKIPLLIINYTFYCLWDYRFAVLLLILTIIVYSCALNHKKKYYYLAGIILPLAVLCFFKYFDFFLENIGQNRLNIIIPVGISFYIFEAISYVIDVKRGLINAEKDFLSFATYLSFFPNIVSGPIARAPKLLPQIKKGLAIRIDNMLVGIQIMAFGYFKKMVIADHLAVFVDDVYRMPEAFSSMTVLLAVLSYSILIYMDFSGYSDIAIGTAKCLGIEFDRNFNLPYLAKSVSEFWHRWHISLSTWFRDYVYIPLGGNRLGRTRQYLNQLIVMTLSGLWHGADWTFVFWGGLNGLLMIAEKIIMPKASHKAGNIFRIILTYFLISLTWIFFRADSLGQAFVILKQIFIFEKGIVQPYLWSFFAFGILLVSSLWAASKAEDKDRIDGFYPILDLKTTKGLTIFFVFVGLIICLAYTNANPFVYLQF
ncbi:MAG: hypothetical protein PUD22_09915 [Erysipelotrichaceae bacterium]|nr:hypothetical protein [Erysipelotrichaceae bacterium]